MPSWSQPLRYGHRQKFSQSNVSNDFRGALILQCYLEGIFISNAGAYVYIHALATTTKIKECVRYSIPQKKS